MKDHNVYYETFGHNIAECHMHWITLNAVINLMPEISHFHMNLEENQGHVNSMCPLLIMNFVSPQYL